MIIVRMSVLLALLFTCANAADQQELQARRQRAASAFADGILLVHARSAIDDETDGFRQDPAFYYLTGLENTPGAILAIDGRSRESWLFLPTHAMYWNIRPPEISPGATAVQRSRIQHVVDWSELERFLALASSSPLRLYYVGQSILPELPPAFTGHAPLPSDGYLDPVEMPTWVAVIGTRWASFEMTEARDRVYALMDVPSEFELVKLRAAAKASVVSLIAGMRAVKAGASQRNAEWAMVGACWQSGARNAWWPWAMSGPNSVRPAFRVSVARYDHLDRVMNSGELVRMDDACDVDHYAADLGRTVPVSGSFGPEQREIWNAFVAAYREGAKSIREGATVNQVFAAWRTELLRHAASVRTALAKEAIERWSKRENLDAFLVHTLSPNQGDAVEPFRAGTAIAFEPQVSIKGQAFFLEDNFLITRTGSELLSPGLPYTAEEIEAVMQETRR